MGSTKLRVDALEECVLYDADGEMVGVLPKQDIVVMKIVDPVICRTTLLVIDRAILERGGMVRLRG